VCVGKKHQKAEEALKLTEEKSKQDAEIHAIVTRSKLELTKKV
jgi:hypothetical protein